MMNTTVSVSVIIPTHNRMDLLHRALKSVDAQSVVPSEIIVVDDGSSDGTAEMLVKQFPHVHYIFQENQGVSKARNVGIEHAKGDWVALLDSDDEWLSNKLERQLQQLKLNPQIRLCHTEEIWIRCGKRVNAMNKHRKYGGYIYNECLPLCVISPSSVVIHREIFQDVGLFDETLPACEDYDLWLRVCSQYPVVFSEEPLIIKHGGHDDQLSRRYWGMDRFRIQALQNILNSQTLSEPQYIATVGMLVEKCRIYIQGANKRGKHDEVLFYQKIIESFMPIANEINKKSAADA